MNNTGDGGKASFIYVHDGESYRVRGNFLQRKTDGAWVDVGKVRDIMKKR